MQGAPIGFVNVWEAYVFGLFHGFFLGPIQVCAVSAMQQSYSRENNLNPQPSTQIPNPRASKP